jgi:hypothetical protein
MSGQPVKETASEHLKRLYNDYMERGYSNLSAILDLW